MKAWEDLENNPDISLCWTEESKFYIDKAKIEKFDDGRIVIQSVIGPGHKFRNLTSRQMFYFENFGWEAGKLKLMSDHYESKANEANRLLQSNYNDRTRSALLRRKKEHMEKKFIYDRALNKELESLSCEALLKNL
jgi:hypothetical protein